MLVTDMDYCLSTSVRSLFELHIILPLKFKGKQACTKCIHCTGTIEFILQDMFGKELLNLLHCESM